MKLACKSVWKRAAAFVVLVAILPMFTGCSIQLYDRLLIHAIGVDRTETGYRTTVRAARAGNEEKEEVLTGEGETVFLALDSIKMKTGKYPLYSHNYLVILGRSCCENGLDDTLDFFSRHFESRPSVKLFMADGSAEELLNVQQNDELIASDAIEDMIDVDITGGSAVNMRVIDFSNARTIPGSAACLPILSAGKDVIELKDTALFAQGKLCDTLDTYETSGLLAVQGTLQGVTYALENDQRETVSLRIGKSDVKFSRGENTYDIKVQIRCEADMISYDSAPGGDGWNDQTLSAALSQEIYKQAEAVIEKTLVKNQCDVFGFGIFLAAHDRSLWQKLREDPESIVGQYRIFVDVQAQVNHVGGEIFPFL